MQLFLIREPRALVLTTDTHCLVLRPKPPSATTSGVAVVVEFLPRGEVDIDVAVQLHGRVSGSLGLLRIADGELSCVLFELLWYRWARRGGESDSAEERCSSQGVRHSC
jgi:hypothetical protein